MLRMKPFVLDATTGQNAISQAKSLDACDITGVVLTKLDGTAKGGVVVAIKSELNVPVKLIGVGEGLTTCAHSYRASLLRLIP